MHLWSGAAGGAGEIRESVCELCLFTTEDFGRSLSELVKVNDPDLIGRRRLWFEHQSATPLAADQS